MRTTHHLVLMTVAVLLATTATLASVELASSQRAADRHADILGDVRLPALDSASFNTRGAWAKARRRSAPARSRDDAQRLFTQRIRALAALGGRGSPPASAGR